MKKLLHPELVSLLNANAVQSAKVTADNGGFYLTFSINGHARMLHTQRGNVRLFKYVDSTIAYLHRLGISECTMTFNDLNSTPRLFT
jgi:hypothetical protein